MKLPQDFYVYLHKKATTGEVFYVGKGNRRRAWKRQRGAMWRAIAKKHGFVVEIVQDGLQEWAAFELEQDLIALHGRRDLGYGPLANMTDGGDGAAGCKSTEEKRKKLSAHFKGVARKPDVAEKIKKALADPEVQARRSASISRARKGVPMSESHYANWAASALTPEKIAKRTEQLRKKFAKSVCCVETGVVFEAITDAMNWLNSSGVPANSNYKITMACKGQRNRAYGYTWRYADQ